MFMIMPMVVCNLIRTLLLPLTMVCVRNSILRMSIWKSGQIATDKPVDIRNGTTHILADSMQVKDNGKVLIFENNVHMTVDGNTHWQTKPLKGVEDGFKAHVSSKREPVLG